MSDLEDHLEDESAEHGENAPIGGAENGGAENGGADILPNGAGENSPDEHVSPNEQNEREKFVRNKRKYFRGKITRATNRIHQGIQGQQNTKRLQKQVGEIREDYNQACEFHNELYNFIDDDQIARMDQWESDLVNDVYSIEEAVEDYVKSVTMAQGGQLSHGTVTRSISARSQQLSANTQSERPESLMPQRQETVHDQVTGADNFEHSSALASSVTERNGQSSISVQQDVPRQGERANNSERSFDAWINDLIEFKETELVSSMNNLSIAEALYRLEASRDLPTLELPKFSGDALDYVEFMERFKIQVHGKPHLTDDIRMAQLKSHVKGEAERAITGLGSGGKMYATALKTLKEQFGQPSVIARACVNRLTKGGNIHANDRQALRDLSLDLINARATFLRINYFADANANETLRQIIRRLPDHLIGKWKTVVTGIRESGELPTIDHISSFIRKKVQAEYDPDFGNLETGQNKGQRSDWRGPRTVKKGVNATQNQRRPTECYVCRAEHKVVNCPTFADSSIEERVKQVKDHRLCFSCLTKGHMASQCRSKVKCNKNGCTRFHHTLLHSDPPSVSGTSPLDKGSIMPVVRVTFRSANGKMREGNILVDSGAGTTIIRRDFAKALGLQGKREGLSLAVVGGEQIDQPHSRRLKFWVSPLNGGEEYSIEAHEVDQTIISVPALDRPWLKSFSHLSDLSFSHKAGPVDVILGVHYSHLHAESETRQGLPFEPVAKKTVLGWYIIGPNQEKSSSVCSVNFVEKIDLQKFYEFETLGVQASECFCPKPAISRYDKRALDLMEASCIKRGDRYTIGLPWKRDPGQLPDNYPLAEKRLESLERSLLKNPAKAQMYSDAITDYEKNGWSCPVTEEELKSDIKPVSYLPHHGVYRPEKLSTPLRIVFDPASPYQGISLNSFLYKGPGLIGNLLGVLLRFREDNVAFAGDISKMYLQICLPEEDTHLHRYLWRDLDTTKKPTVHRLLRVAFGTKASPEMASYVMLRIADEHKDSLPDVSTILQRDRYMDDLIHSCPSVDVALELIRGLESALQTGSFEIKEWFISSESAKRQLASAKLDQMSKPVDVEENQLMTASNNEEPDSSGEVNLDGQEDVKTLGVGWNPKTDKLKFAVKPLHLNKFTKRNILSKMSMLYDPLGLASCVTIKARVGMQEIWRCKEYDWDDPLSNEMVELWKGLFRDIEDLKSVEFPRCLKPEDAYGESEMHVFSDASKMAYGAVAYLLWHTPRGPEVQLISAKARVAPLHHTTIPRLELMAALIASRLAKTVTDEFKQKPIKVTLWTDSQIVLHWLRTESITMKAFVGVRVAEIQSTWDPVNWRFVPTNLNPADDLSRGLSAEDLGGRWIHGPSFLKEPQQNWPVEPSQPVKVELEYKNVKPICAVQKILPFIAVEKHSNWQRLLRITAYCLRFIHNIRSRSQAKRLGGTLQCSEVDESKKYWITMAQQELGDWKNKFPDLNPFIENDIIRVGGRIKRSQLSYDQVHPILLPSDHHVSKLIMKHVHDKIGHAGAERTLCDCRREFWMIRGRNLAKGIVRKCVICRKLRQPPHSTLMADLPADRLKPFQPTFSVTGVDLFGPFYLRYGRNKSKKAWGAVFTCATSRAIHLEIVDGLSTEAFLQALRRFVAHHGWPNTVISDNGTSFVGARRELKTLVQEGRKQIEAFATLHQVKWKFITPLSPHQGGFYESLVKQVKGALQVAIGQQVLPWNEMATVFAEVECLVNSRPIGFAPNNPNDLQPLTPNHFILGRATPDVPQGPFEETKNLRKRFQFVQMLVHQFWKRFIKEYIPTLMRRSKWQLKGRQLQVDDVVLLIEPNVPRGKWNLARIMEVYAGQDDIVRNVKVKTKTGEYKRSVQKCCPILEADSDSQ